MTSIDKININKNNPKILVFNPPTVLGRDVIERLIQKNGYVVVVSEFQKEIQEFNRFFSSTSFSFFDYSGLDSIQDTYPNFDYLIYFSNISGGKFISAERFLQKSVEIRRFLKLLENYNSKAVVVTNLSLARTDKEEMLDEDFLKYDDYELQRYIESLSMEYAQKRSANLRIVRLGEVLGEKINPENGLISNMIFSAIFNSSCTIPQDGLERAEILHYQDASSCILKSLFNEKLKGKILNLALPNEYTILTIAYKIRDLLNKDINVQFSDSISNAKTVASVDKIIDSINLLDFMPTISLEKTLVDTINKTQFTDFYNTNIVKQLDSDINYQEEVKQEVVQKEQKIDMVPVNQIYIKQDRKDSLQNTSISTDTKDSLPNPKRVILNSREPRVNKKGEKIRIDSTITIASIVKTIIISSIIALVFIFIIFPIYRIANLYKQFSDSDNANLVYLDDVRLKLENFSSELKTLPFAAINYMLELKNLKLIEYINHLNDLVSLKKDISLSELGIDINESYKIELSDQKLNIKVTNNKTLTVNDKTYNYGDYQKVKNKILNIKSQIVDIKSIPRTVQDILRINSYIDSIQIHNSEILSI